MRDKLTLNLMSGVVLYLPYSQWWRNFLIVSFRSHFLSGGSKATFQTATLRFGIVCVNVWLWWSCSDKVSARSCNWQSPFEGDRMPARRQDHISTDYQVVVLYNPRWGLWSSCGLWESQWYLKVFSTHMLQNMKRETGADILQMSVKWDNWACL